MINFTMQSHDDCNIYTRWVILISVVHGNITNETQFQSLFWYFNYDYIIFGLCQTTVNVSKSNHE